MSQDNLPVIGCLGWGSLIWDPRNLPVKDEWLNDGPLLPIEFARESGDGRITLVICEVDYQVRTYWAQLNIPNLQAAKAALAAREKISEKNIERSIGFWEKSSNTSYGNGASEIAAWAQAMNIDAVVWTNLKPGMQGRRGTLPSSAEVIEHLRKLPDEKREAAEKYVRNTRVQIDTEYRRCIARELGWLPAES